MFNTIHSEIQTHEDDGLPNGRIRRTNACNFCREKKIRCNGENPCANCQDHGKKCVMLKRRRGRLKATDPNSTSLSARLQRIEETLSLSSLARARVAHAAPKEKNVMAVDVLTSTEQTEHLTGESEQMCQGELENCSIYSAEASNFDYQGPRTLLSIFSPPAIKWVREILKNDAFNRPALMCIKEISRRFKVDRSWSTQLAHELPRKMIWDYVNAYFTSAYSIEFGVVQQQSFEHQLQLEFRSQEAETQRTHDFDAAWYALKNAVLAVGCRIELGRTSNFQDACEASWKLFGNALSMHTRLLYERTSLVGVQALIVMAYYTEAVGSPTLQYMLCSSAVRLAFSKALHKQPPKAWNIAPEEVLQRNWMFWAIYCLEKQISMRSGRPSLLEDDEIDVDIPYRACSDVPGSLEYCTIAIKIARLSSRLRKKLSSARALRQSLKDTVHAVAELNLELGALESESDFILGPSMDFNSSWRPDYLSTKQIIALRFMFYGLTFDLHTRLTYPWCAGVSTLQNDPDNTTHMQRSRTVVLDVCRNAILLTRHISLDASTPLLVGIVVPLHTAANLFIDILRHPQSPAARSDLALLDVLAGFFARVDFATDWGFCARFVREMARLARQHVENSSTKNSSAGEYNNDGNDLIHLTPDSMLDWNNVNMDSTLYDLPSVHDLDEWRSFLELGDDFELGIWPT